MRRLIGVEITEDMPRLSTDTAIERPSQNVRVMWRYYDAGFVRSCHTSGGTLDLTGLGDIDDADGIESLSFAEDR